LDILSWYKHWWEKLYQYAGENCPSAEEVKAFSSVGQKPPYNPDYRGKLPPYHSQKKQKGGSIKDY